MSQVGWRPWFLTVAHPCKQRNKFKTTLKTLQPSQGNQSQRLSQTNNTKKYFWHCQAMIAKPSGTLRQKKNIRKRMRNWYWSGTQLPVLMDFGSQLLGPSPVQSAISGLRIYAAKYINIYKYLYIYIICVISLETIEIQWAIERRHVWTSSANQLELSA